MGKDAGDEALDRIQHVATFLLVRNDLPDEACEYLRIIEALARHRDLSNFLSPEDEERLVRISRTNE